MDVPLYSQSSTLLLSFRTRFFIDSVVVDEDNGDLMVTLKSTHKNESHRVNRDDVLTGTMLHPTKPQLRFNDGVTFTASNRASAQRVLTLFQENLTRDENRFNTCEDVTMEEIPLPAPPPPHDWSMIPLPLPHETWGDPGTHGFKVRSRSYLQTRSKVQAPPPLFRMFALDLFRSETKIDNITKHPLNRIALARANGIDTFAYVIVFQIPAHPIPGSPNGFYSYCQYFEPIDERVKWILKHKSANLPDDLGGFTPSPARHELSTQLHKGTASLRSMYSTDKSEDDGNNNHNHTTDDLVDGDGGGSDNTFGPAYPQLLLDFFLGADDSIRQKHLKMIPRVIEGPMMLTSLTPQNKPVLIATKTKMRSYVSENCLELDIDTCMGDMLADTLSKSGTTHAKRVICDVAYFIESKYDDQLPEFICGTMRANHIDLKKDMKVLDAVVV